MKFTLKEILEATDAKVLKNTKNTIEYIVSTDTRTIKSNNIYLPLKGESFDGEDFIEKALENGAKAYFTRSGNVFDKADIILQIEDSLTTYLQFAKFYLNKISPKVIALTGSSGKTTTKEMLTAVCKQQFKTHSTPLNYNNEIGFCQTILSMPKDTEILILEMGMRGLGEIELLSKYSTPDVTVITNVGTSHIGRLSSVENIAKAKCEIVKFQKENGLFIAPENNLIKNTVEFKGEKKYFNISDVKFLEKSVGKTRFLYKKFEYQLNIEGDYNVENALATINVGLALNISPEKINLGLKSYMPIGKRWEIIETDDYKIINDSYNANPDSMKATISTVLELYPQTVLILGNMGELGETEIFYHQQIGEFIITKAQNPQELIVLTVGDLAKEITKKLSEKNIFSINFEKNSDVEKYIRDKIKKGSIMFFKASRAMKFEEIIDRIKGENK